MPAKVDSVIVDTNLWVSFLITNDFSKLDLMLTKQKIKLIFSQELLEEFIEVAQRPKFKKYFSVDDLESLLSSIKIYAVFVNVKTVVSICRDEKDNFLLALAKDGKATHLLTGDKDLLALHPFGKTKILTITEYLKLS